MIGPRILDRLNAAGFTQSELARRVGMSQQAVHKLVKGTSRSTANLHRIARELGTTPAYLTGETDDPLADASPPPALTSDQMRLVEVLLELDRREQRAVFTIVDALKARPPASELTLPNENVLGQMFEGLLAGVDTAMPTVELARLLAQGLPIGLERARALPPHVQSGMGAEQSPTARPVAKHPDGAPQ